MFAIHQGDRIDPPLALRSQPDRLVVEYCTPTEIVLFYYLGEQSCVRLPALRIEVAGTLRELSQVVSVEFDWNRKGWRITAVPAGKASTFHTLSDYIRRDRDEYLVYAQGLRRSCVKRRFCRVAA